MRLRTCQSEHRPVITSLWVSTTLPSSFCSFSAAHQYALHVVHGQFCNSDSSSAGLIPHVQMQVEDVITQVTRRDQLPAGSHTAAYPKATEQDGVDSRITWKTKLRSLLCCLAPPQNDHYFRSSEAEAVVIRPPRAVVPPPRPPGHCDAAYYEMLSSYQVFTGCCLTMLHGNYKHVQAVMLHPPCLTEVLILTNLWQGHQ